MSSLDVARLSGPRGTISLRAREHPLSSPSRQKAFLQSVDLSAAPHSGDFDRAIAASGQEFLRPGALEILQINVGKFCNMTCRHCHVDAGPDRSSEQMDRETAEACLRALDRTNAHTVDFTGGAPELNPHFRYLVEEAVRRGKHVIDRCNLSVLLLPRSGDLPEWLAERGVEIVASLPHWRRRGTDSQRGEGTFEASIEALRLLNGAGYGRGNPRKRLTLMSNPVGAFLPANQASLEREWKEGLRRERAVDFDRLVTLTNMPIARYLEWLDSSGNVRAYMETLVRAFNAATVSGLMCRNTLSVSWDGRLYDCDFNQMLDLPLLYAARPRSHVRDLLGTDLNGTPIVVADHCYGCTAGQGSSCGGALAD